jgi:hypothetical protein
VLNGLTDSIDQDVFVFRSCNQDEVWVKILAKLVAINTGTSCVVCSRTESFLDGLLHGKATTHSRIPHQKEGRRELPFHKPAEEVDSFVLSLYVSEHSSPVEATQAGGSGPRARTGESRGNADHTAHRRADGVRYRSAEAAPYTEDKGRDRTKILFRACSSLAQFAA